MPSVPRLTDTIQSYYDTIVSERSFQHRVQQQRAGRGWSQDELARRAGLSRTAISAIETGRVVPSTAAALALAEAFDCRVEDLFLLAGRARREAPRWAWPPAAEPARFWRATVGSDSVLYPVERTAVGLVPADGTVDGEKLALHPSADPQRTLVLAGCDPAVGLIAAELARVSSVRLLPLTRPSRQSLDLLRQNLVHVAGIHLQDPGTPRGNRQAVREFAGRGYKLLRLTRWQEGLALAPGLGIDSITRAVAANLRWVGRVEGSGARRCLDWILEGRRPLPAGYHHVAADHSGVVETIRTGWAQAGICVHLSALEAGLDFLIAREEDYDLCYREEMEDDPRLQALLEAVRSHSFRRALAELPGYQSAHTGELISVSA